MPGATILNFGKAECNEGIFERLDKYRRFGRGRNSGHSGGRAIWQLEDTDDLKVCWLRTPGLKPGAVEHNLIAAFKIKHGDIRPFANQNDGRKSS